MATFHDLELDWSALCQECTECWTDSDLQLAAELGKTLLERNKELETALKSHQNVIEDQAQEIEYLTKQTVALREVNDSRLRIYEQLEISIQDLERANHRLALDHSSDKKQIKTFTGTIEGLETRCEELQKTVEELTRLLEVQKHRAERQNEQQKESKSKTEEVKCEVKQEKAQNVLKNKDKIVCQQQENLCKEELLKMNDELVECRLSQMKEQRRVVELEEQLSTMIQSNNQLQEKLREKNQNEDAMKSMQDELSILEEMRQQQLCMRCLRTVDGVTDDMSSIMDAEDEDGRSVVSSQADEPYSLVTTPYKLVSLQNQNGKYVQNWNANNSDAGNNLYRDLVEKYEALLEVQRNQVNNIRKAKQVSNVTSHNTSAPLSLQEELQMSGDFTQFNIKDTDEESGHGNETSKPSEVQTKIGKNENRKNFIRTPDFSEAETSSSGFSDETSNKATQTDRERPGSFLCTIADGEDCRFSIYDDGSPLDSRFRNRPEYRELFKEIFGILKKAADNKDDGEKLPLLDDTIPGHVKVPPVTPAAEEAPGDFTDETQSIISSVMSEVSVPYSDMSPPDHIKEKENIPKCLKEVKKQLEDEVAQKPSKNKEDKNEEPERVLTPLVRQPLEYMSATAQFKKRSNRHKNRKHSQDRQGAESPVIPSPPRIVYQRGGGGHKRRRDYKPLDQSPLVKGSHSSVEYNGSSLNFYNSSIASPITSQNGSKLSTYQRWNPETESWDIKQSLASQELNKLRKLELSYAEVLRNADKTKGRRRRHQ